MCLLLGLAGARSIRLQVEPPTTVSVAARGATDRRGSCAHPPEGLWPHGRTEPVKATTADAGIAPSSAAARYEVVLHLRACERALLFAGWTHRQAKADCASLARETGAR